MNARNLAVPRPDALDPISPPLIDLNRSFDQVAEGLQSLQEVPFFQRELIRHALSDVEIARVYAN